jgi:hypothetical protein
MAPVSGTAAVVMRGSVCCNQLHLFGAAGLWLLRVGLVCSTFSKRFVKAQCNNVSLVPGFSLLTRVGNEGCNCMLGIPRMIRIREPIPKFDCTAMSCDKPGVRRLLSA